MLQRYLISYCLLFLLGCSADKKQSLAFELLPATATGVAFENTITESDSVNLFDYYYIYNGAGVAVGDVNNDGAPDLFFGGNMVSSRLYLNKGALTFQDITQEAGLSTEVWVMGVTLVYAALIVLANIVVDVLYAVADPRVEE